MHSFKCQNQRSMWKKGWQLLHLPSKSYIENLFLVHFIISIKSICFRNATQNPQSPKWKGSSPFAGEFQIFLRAGDNKLQMPLATSPLQVGHLQMTTADGEDCTPDKKNCSYSCSQHPIQLRGKFSKNFNYFMQSVCECT